MRILLIAAALLFAAPAFAQESVEQQMDRAEEGLRREMAPAGVVVERASPGEIRMRMPSDITFDFNRANIRGEFWPRISDLAGVLRRSPDLYISIVGHADAIGSDGYNQRLSERRAYAVGNALLDEGVRRRRIAASGMGEMQPLDTNATEWGRARNRRVEIRVIGAPHREDRSDAEPRFE